MIIGMSTCSLVCRDQALKYELQKTTYPHNYNVNVAIDIHVIRERAFAVS